MLKPGGAGMSTAAILRAAGLALARAPAIHSHLEEALAVLEQKYSAMRSERLEQLRALRLLEAKFLAAAGEGNGDMAGSRPVASDGDGGIDVDDPILRYDFNHATAPLGKSEARR